MLLNVTQAAKELGVSTETVRRNIRAGHWPFYRLGPKTTRVDVEEIRALGKFIAQRRPGLEENR
jgi:excisionase family DNA binding protein